MRFSRFGRLVDDVVEQAGGVFLGTPRARPDRGIRVAYLRDPAGSLVEPHEVLPMEQE